MTTKEFLINELANIENEIEKITEEIMHMENSGIRGYLVLKLVRCGKSQCHCMRGGNLHGPYPHLQWHDENGKTKTKYINRKKLPEVQKKLMEREKLNKRLNELKVLKTQKELEMKNMGIS